MMVNIVQRDRQLFWGDVYNERMRNRILNGIDCGMRGMNFNIVENHKSIYMHLRETKNRDAFI